MTADSYEAVEAVLSSRLPKRCAIGFEEDVRHLVLHDSTWDSVEIHTNRDSSRILEVKLCVSSAVEDLRKISGALIVIWNNLRYQAFGAESTTWYQDSLHFRFITVPSDEKYCVVGRIFIGGYQYSDLIRIAENKSKRRYPTSPIKIDFTGLELEPNRFDRDERDWQFDESLINSILDECQALKQIAGSSMQDFGRNRQGQDSVVLRLQKLLYLRRDLSLTVENEIEGFRGAVCNLSKSLHFGHRPWDLEAAEIWSLLHQDVQTISSGLSIYLKKNRSSRSLS
ncbi:MAG: hypothetical protein KC777_16785 [Cyanobacteria bacterium HKST-UBA02]|nr:hypothetical protein [Cyanobacteria bacterium HKST-UBA02]